MPHEPFNQLTPAEAERLDVLAEECAEVILAISKIKRHGFASHNPDDIHHINNGHQLAKEMGDLLSAIELVLEHDIDADTVRAYRDAKPAKRARYMHHQED